MCVQADTSVANPAPSDSKSGEFISWRHYRGMRRRRWRNHQGRLMRRHHIRPRMQCDGRLASTLGKCILKPATEIVVRWKIVLDYNA